MATITYKCFLQLPSLPHPGNHKRRDGAKNATVLVEREVVIYKNRRHFGSLLCPTGWRSPGGGGTLLGTGPPWLWPLSCGTPHLALVTERH